MKSKKETTEIQKTLKEKVTSLFNEVEDNMKVKTKAECETKESRGTADD